VTAECAALVLAQQDYHAITKNQKLIQYYWTGELKQQLRVMQKPQSE
jgi:hypothetical protein